MDAPFRVLVCGDVDIRTQLATTLREHATIEEVSTRDEALLAVRSRTFDAVFIDIDRPEQNGLNIAARVRRVIPGRVRLIAISEFNRTSDLTASRNAGFDLRVARPIQVEQVLAALHTIRSPLT